MSLGKSIFSFRNEKEQMPAQDLLRLHILDNELISDMAWYLEPVEVEVYIKEEARFDVTIEILKIKLPEVSPLSTSSEKWNKFSEEIFNYAKEKDEPIDILEWVDKDEELYSVYQKTYLQHEDSLKKISEQKSALLEGSPQIAKKILYLVEMLLKFESSLLCLSYLGDVHTFNLNWFLKRLNKERSIVNLEINTVEYLIKRCDLLAGDYVYDENYQRLSALYLHKMRDEY